MLNLSLSALVSQGRSICNCFIGQSPSPAVVWAGGGGAAVRDERPGRQPAAGARLGGGGRQPGRRDGLPARGKASLRVTDSSTTNICLG